LSSAIERRNFQQIQMEKLKLDFEFLEATSIHDAFACFGNELFSISILKTD
jgi:hypothetical protein